MHDPDDWPDRNPDMPVTKAHAVLRKMRGQAQAHLVAAIDGKAYVVKFSNNPQGAGRILVNEYLAAFILKKLGVATPSPAIIIVDDEFLAANPGLRLGHAGSWNVVEVGPHFGSTYPGDPQRDSAYDFLPDKLLPQVYNIKDFWGALVMDCWLSNSDLRQAVFCRVSVPDSIHSGVRASWRAQMIDNGNVFCGGAWTFDDSAVKGAYPRTVVYGPNPSMRDVEPWLERISRLSIPSLLAAAARIPAPWLADDQKNFSLLLSHLESRRRCLPEMVRNNLQMLRRKRGAESGMNATPGWRRIGFRVDSELG